MLRAIYGLIAVSMIVATAASCAVDVEDESSVAETSQDGAELIASSSQALGSCVHNCECDLGS